MICSIFYLFRENDLVKLQKFNCVKLTLSSFILWISHNVCITVFSSTSTPMEIDMTKNPRKHTAAIEAIEEDWKENPRWRDVKRDYTAEDVFRLRGSLVIEHTLAHRGAEKLWRLLATKPYVNSLGALTGNQAMQQVKAGLQAIYLSGWQVAADGNDSCQMYPDQSLYSVSSVPSVVRRINNALMRADQLHHAEGDDTVDWFAPIVADAESGFGGVLNAHELMKAMIEAGAAGVHFEDQLASVKKCGHMGGKVLVSTREAVQKLCAARLAADVMGVPTLLLARTDAEAATLVTSDVDENDKPFITGERTAEGYYRVRAGFDQAVSRGLAYAPYADMIWCETGTPDLAFARKYAEAIRKVYPNKMLAYNCSPSFNWRKNLDAATIAKFQRELGAMGYKFQFVTLAGFHALNYGMFELASGYVHEQMSAYVRLQEAEFAAEKLGYTATRHQREVGTGYFDAVTQVVQGRQSSTTALSGSTEEAQFQDAPPKVAAVG
jgi:isocitrate lyase